MNWTIEYENDVGPNDEGFWCWWNVTDGTRTFEANTEEDAKWLCDLLNTHALDTPNPAVDPRPTSKGEKQ